MPETEPTPWELMRLMRQVDAKLDQVVTKDMFQAESRRVDERFEEQGRDIADERTARTEALGNERVARERGDAEERAAREKDALALDTKIKQVESEWKDKAARQAVWIRWLAGGIAFPVVIIIIQRFGGLS